MRRRDRDERYGYGGYDDVGRRYSRRASERYVLIKCLNFTFPTISDATSFLNHSNCLGD